MSETVADMLDASFYSATFDRAADPVAWIRDTTLYRALVADLPIKRRKLRKLAERARHWSTCPCRTNIKAACSCPKRLERA